MRNRVKYDWKITDFIFTFFRSFSCIFFCCCRSKNKFHLRKKQEIYEKGETKFIKEFDAVYYARCMRNMNTLVTSMMDESERFMITYQKCNSISLYSDTTSSHSDENYDGVPKLYSNEKKKLRHKAKVDDFMV